MGVGFRFGPVDGVDDVDDVDGVDKMDKVDGRPKALGLLWIRPSI
jgi:hypothetical protein